MPPSPQDTWDSCLEVIRDNISRQSFRTWFEPLKAVALEEEDGLRKLTVQLPSRFYYEWLEEHYFALLRKTVAKVLGPEGRLFYEVVIEREAPEMDGASVHLPARRPVNVPRDGEEHRGGTPAPASEPRGSTFPPPTPGTHGAPLVNPFVVPGIKRRVEPKLNESYIFERFIEGDCNRLARSAAKAISEQPGATAFNPFLVYGGVGLGKTHLIQAIGNYVYANHRDANVLYVSSEQFTAEFVQAIQRGNIGDFSSYYRQIDLLIVDDVQFFGGKEKTQEEFFHLFNALHQSGKQIVLSADRPPKDIAGIEERLLSRLSWGLTADMQKPELETRIAILRRKAEDEGLDVDPQVVEYIAHHVKSNIRELEGSLIRILAHAALHGRELDLPLAKEVLRDLIKDARGQLTVDEIQEVVCDYFRISQDLVRARTRKREIVQARQVAMYFSKQLTKNSLKSIGLHFGGRDHSTVIHGVQSVENQIDTDPQFRSTIDEIRNKLDLVAR